MKKFKSPISFGIIFTVLIFLVHMFFSYFIDNRNIIILLRPIRDFLFFPFLLLVNNVSEMYCWFAKIAFFDYGRCIVPTGPGLNMPIGPPEFFELTIFAFAVIAIAVYYIIVFKIIVILFKSYLKLKKYMEIIIPNQEKFETIKSKIREAGFEKLHVLADFDRTLTYGVIDGKETPSIISLLRDGNHLTEGYAEKAHALFDKYSVIENKLELPLEERKLAMQEWWERHNKLLTESGLEKSDLEDIVTNGHLKFREGLLEFLDFLNEKKIPLIVLSASGCGDAIEMFFEKFNKNYSNIFYVTNQFNWDEQGKVISEQVFAEGWLGEDGKAIGRPVDILELPDGSLLVSDDHAGVIYKISYTGD